MRKMVGEGLEKEREKAGKTRHDKQESTYK